KHHLLRTFWVGRGGWRDRQLPDGTIVWTAPTGHTYITRPGALLYFPGWKTSTGALRRVDGDLPEPAGRALRMPRRPSTRQTERARRITNRRAYCDTG
ncbi:MAG: hypothetical protein EBU23_10855, partial [Mycobacteriaceae bacterium]|nr:hypothetical protein [Mycobacteriaceae bacterium]